jgi:hypothetical protein
MSLLVPPPEIMPVTKQNQGMLKYFSMNAGIPSIAEVLTARVEAHQRYILTTYCETPAVLGGDAGSSVCRLRGLWRGAKINATA